MNLRFWDQTAHWLAGFAMATLVYRLEWLPPTLLVFWLFMLTALLMKWNVRGEERAGRPRD
jgi:1-acyl-sn-glycerol-3-phosphate acyltransferase